MFKTPLRFIIPAFLFAIIFQIESHAQVSDLAIGQWYQHLPYQTGKHVTQNTSKVFYATPLSVLSIEKDEMSIERISKVEGLSDVGMGIIAYSPFSETLVLTYTNGNLDLMKEGTDVINLPFIKNKDIVGDKTIYHIFFEHENRAFISTGFGILELKPETEEFGDDIRTGVPVRGTSILDGQIYAATEEGIYIVANDANVNSQDFGNWQLLGESEGFPADYSSTAIARFDNKLYLGINDSLFQYKNGELKFLHFEDGYSLTFLSAGRTKVFAGYRCDTNCSGKVLFVDANGRTSPGASNCNNRPNGAIEDENGQIWYADEWREFRTLEPGSSNCGHLKFNAPYSANVQEISLHEDEVWIATGGVTTNYEYLFREDGFFSYIDGEWDVFNRKTRPEMKGADPNEASDDIRDIYTIAVHPETGHVYAGSYLEGLVVFDRENISIANEFNSSLQTVVGDPGRVRVSGLAFDDTNNLWISNFLAPNPFSVLTNEGTWKNFSPSGCGNAAMPTQVVVDRVGNKWFALADNAAGVMVFNEGESITDTSDDRCRVFTSSNSELPNNTVNCLVVDLDGGVWVGTENGVTIFECDPFDEACKGFLKIVTVDGDNEYLLKGENVQTMAVDGANRKWVGTSNGVFVLSPDGEENLAFFDVDNSPLFDNSVIDIAIEPKTGEVFIGTGSGLQVIRGEAIEGLAIHQSEVVVFPQPVRPEYDGPIAISGLAKDADVKITDIRGQLIYETQALGGQAIWDGRDYNGRRASSGVYLVLSTSTQNLDNPDSVVAKILFMN